MLKILNRKLTPEQFREYVNALKIGRRIDKLVFHHTSSPTETWDGSASMLHYWNLYRSRGQKAGPHIFIAPSGIWLFTPLWKKGQHAGKEGNKRSIGIEVVGRFFSHPPADHDLCFSVAHTTKTLLNKFPKAEIFNHLYFEPHTFCSPEINRDWVLKNLDDFEALI